MSKPLSENALKVINAVRTKRSTEDTMQILGLSKPALVGIVGGLKSRGLATMADGMITLTDEGKALVNRKRGVSTNPDKKTAQAHAILSTPEMMDLLKKSQEGDRGARKQRVIALMEQLQMSQAGANTYVGNFDARLRETTDGATA